MTRTAIAASLVLTLASCGDDGSQPGCPSRAELSGDFDTVVTFAEDCDGAFPDAPGTSAVTTLDVRPGAFADAACVVIQDEFDADACTLRRARRCSADFDGVAFEIVQVITWFDGADEIEMTSRVTDQDGANAFCTLRIDSTGRRL